MNAEINRTCKDFSSDIDTFKQYFCQEIKDIDEINTKINSLASSDAMDTSAGTGSKTDKHKNNVIRDLPESVD